MRAVRCGGEEDLVEVRKWDRVLYYDGFRNRGRGGEEGEI